MRDVVERRQLHHQASADIGKGLAAIDGNALIVAQPFDLEILEADRDGSACIFPACTGRHRQYHYT